MSRTLSVPMKVGGLTLRLELFSAKKGTPNRADLVGPVSSTFELSVATTPADIQLLNCCAVSVTGK